MLGSQNPPCGSKAPPLRLATFTPAAQLVPGLATEATWQSFITCFPNLRSCPLSRSPVSHRNLGSIVVDLCCEQSWAAVCPM
jgi:hypothetical protein